VRARVGDDAAPDAEIRVCGRDGEGAYRHGQLDAVAGGVDPAERAAVDAAADGFQVFDRLQHARLRRARDRRRREGRAHEVGEADVGAQATSHGAHEVGEPRMRFDREEGRDVDGPELTHPPEVVAGEVDDHQVLGPVLLARPQCVRVGSRALDRSCLDVPPGDTEEQLR